MERNDRERPNTGGEQTSSSNDTDRGIRDRVKGVASSVREKASGVPAILADGLQAGAEALRQRRTGAGTSAPGTSVAIAGDSIDVVADSLATGMETSADWLRDADLDKLKKGVEKQVKKHPARSLLVALGAGFLIGKVFRR